jgi:hypothetical protein
MVLADLILDKRLALECLGKVSAESFIFPESWAPIFELALSRATRVCTNGYYELYGY